VRLVLDTAAGVWLDRNGIVTSSKTSKGHAEYDPFLELMRRCRHASASVGVRIYVYGGLKGGEVFFFVLWETYLSCSCSPPLFILLSLQFLMWAGFNHRSLTTSDFNIKLGHN
jgi:hypothetical protein